MSEFLKEWFRLLTFPVTHSASSQPELLNCSTQTDEPQRNSEKNFGCNLSKMQELNREFSTYFPCIEVTWKIPKFTETPRKLNFLVKSAPFSFAGDSWRLILAPNGVTKYPDCILISVMSLKSSSSKLSLCAQLCFKTAWGQKYRSVRTKGSLNENENVLVRPYLKRSHVEASEFLIPEGTVTVFCQLRLLTKPRQALLEIPDGSSGAFSGNHKIIKNTGATHSNLQLELLNSSTQTDEQYPNSQGIHNLQSDYSKLLETEEETDVCLKVSDKEFRAHKCILRARSSVFSAMFKHDTEEKNSDEVVIEDLDPESFPDFLQHVYAGSVDFLSVENVFKLYKASDKYDMADLKSECKSYMERTLSVDTFCDVIVVSLRYKEDDLLKLAIDFFSKNLTKIIVTVKWQKFLEGHVTAGNELLIKALVPSTEE